jgi:TonB family protein
MKTNLIYTRRITALLVAAVIISSSLFAQTSISNPTAKFASFENTRKSSQAVERLNEITSIIEEKIKFKAPLANEVDDPVLVNNENSRENQMEESVTDNNIPEEKEGRLAAAEKTITDSASFRNWLKANLNNQLTEVSKEVSGTLIVRFTVDENGQLSDARIVLPSDPEVDNLVLEVLNNSPKWTVKEMNNKPVKQNFSMPVNYRVKKL